MAKITSYIVVEIGVETLLLPGSTSVDAVVKTLSKAVRCRRCYRDGIRFRPEDGIDIRVSIVSSDSLDIEPEFDPDCRDASPDSRRTHAIASPLQNVRRLTA